MTNEERYYFRDFIPEVYECPCYVKSVITSEPSSTETDGKGIKFTTKISLYLDPKCKWYNIHKGRRV
jgi:hypothetical protein